MAKLITRKDERELPVFKSQNEARIYFTEQYGSDFVFQDIEDINGQQCWFYVLQLDDDSEYGRLFGHQPIQIFDDGTVHIVH